MLSLSLARVDWVIGRPGCAPRASCETSSDPITRGGGGGGGGGHSGLNGYPLPNGRAGGGRDRQNLGAVNSWDKKGEWSTSN